MKKLIALSAILFSIGSMAQNAQQKINNANYELYKANQTIQGSINTVNGTTQGVKGTVNSIDNSTDEIKDAVGKISKIFQSKKKEEKKESVSSNPETNSQINAQPKISVTSSAAITKSVITISNCSFNILKDITANLSGNTNYSILEKSLNNNTAVISVNHTGSTDDLLTFIDSKFPNRFTIVGFQNGSIILASN